jgi:hypothetical protein
VGCDLALNGRVQTGLECQGRVTLNGDELGCNDPNGWTLIDDRHIRLQGDACDQFMSSGSVNLEADFECSIFAPF